ncbi:hypothetical protein Pcinc_006645, partial [Petrolisthes cinctipes]
SADPDSLLGRFNKTIYNAGQPQNTSWGREGIILGSHVAVVTRFALMQIMDAHFSKTGRCTFYIMGESYLKTSALCFLYKKGSPLKTTFNDRLKRLREAGIVEHFYQQAVENATECLKPIRGKSLRPLSLGDFYGVFLIYLGAWNGVNSEGSSKHVTSPRPPPPPEPKIITTRHWCGQGRLEG